MTEILDRTESVFAAAAALATAEERAAFLDHACANDTALRARVEALLFAHDRAGHLLDHPVPCGPVPDIPEQTVAYTPAEQPGTIVAGRYKLLEQIGEGGMGTVWVAEQTQPVRRKVALKLIKPGLDSRSVLARFEAERQALAVMDHPNIAKVLDGGLTETGRPFFVMEYVKGVRITEYCDALRLGIPERLLLFVEVCQAVQHAHQKGIIHRDLKPSNILVAPYDGKPVPKVIDFGLAKAMHQPLTERTLHTAHETVLGTPLYMSPEQAQLNNLDVDTRSDLYSLGVLLYELLTGSTPLEKQRLKEAAWDEVRRIIREEEPPRPSMRLSTSEALPSLAAGRQMEPARLTKLVRGDLDWIAMKALEKDRTRRYETANGFAMDVQRYLAGEPVLAAPPSARYRLRKFVRKHRAALTTAAAMVLLLLAGAGVSTWQAVRAMRAEAAARTAEQDADAKRVDAEQQRKLAEQQRNLAEQQKRRAEAGERLAGERLVQVAAEKKKAEEEKQIAQSVRDFLQYSLLGQADPRTQADALLRRGQNTAETAENPTIRELLERAAKELSPERIDVHFSNQPLVQAEILNSIGRTYEGIGEGELAIGFLQRSTALYRRNLGPDDRKTLGAMENLARAYGSAGKLDLAVLLCEETLKLMKVKLGSYHPDTLQGMNNLATAYSLAGRPDLALPLCEETLRLRKEYLGPYNPDTLMSMGHLAQEYMLTGKLDLAVPLCEETLMLMKEKLGPHHPDTLWSVTNLATAYLFAKKPDLAVPLYEESLKFMKDSFGPYHPETLAIMSNLAEAYGNAGRQDLALPLLKETLRLWKAKYGPDSPGTLLSMNNLATAYWRAKQLKKSIPLFEETLERQTTKLGRQNPDTIVTVANLGMNYKDAGRLVEALPLLEEAYRAAKKYPRLRVFGPALLDAYAQSGKTEQAAALAKELLADMRMQLQKESLHLAAQLAHIAFTLLQAKAFMEAGQLLRESLAICEKTQPDEWSTFTAKSMLGGALAGQKKYAAAEPLLLAGYQGMKQREAKIPPQGKVRLTEALQRLVQFYEATGKKDEAAKWQKELEAAQAKRPAHP
jgi:eukaryotic-like serine/threonine-protein kinase